ncbi:MAG: hypothetical protein HYZ90_06885 [Candidatus Omnitrophica bacterium]|nr:hypothetical protein [Candidatus Omnitrophota bacterium]
MEQDREVEAMRQIAVALKSLDEQATARVLQWAADRFNVASLLNLSGFSPTKSTTRKTETEKGGSGVTDFKDLPSLFDATSPSTASEKALVVGYWFQELQGMENFDAQAVNSQLKHLGHPIVNITAAFNALKETTPALAHQIEKSGKTRQARKKFKITTEGVRKVQAMVQAKSKGGER